MLLTINPNYNKISVQNVSFGKRQVVSKLFTEYKTTKITDFEALIARYNQMAFNEQSLMKKPHPLTIEIQKAQGQCLKEIKKAKAVLDIFIAETNLESLSNKLLQDKCQKATISVIDREAMDYGLDRTSITHAQDIIQKSKTLSSPIDQIMLIMHHYNFAGEYTKQRYLNASKRPYGTSTLEPSLNEVKTLLREFKLLEKFVIENDQLQKAGRGSKKPQQVKRPQLSSLQENYDDLLKEILPLTQMVTNTRYMQ